MTMITITQLSCDVAGCTREWTGEGGRDHLDALEAGWGYSLDSPGKDLCPDHADDPDDSGACP
jgi:hypothetical protein